MSDKAYFLLVSVLIVAVVLLLDWLMRQWKR